VYNASPFGQGPGLVTIVVTEDDPNYGDTLGSQYKLKVTEPAAFTVGAAETTYSIRPGTSKYYTFDLAANTDYYGSYQDAGVVSTYASISPTVYYGGNSYSFPPNAGWSFSSTTAQKAILEIRETSGPPSAEPKEFKLAVATPASRSIAFNSTFTAATAPASVPTLTIREGTHQYYTVTGLTTAGTGTYNLVFQDASSVPATNADVIIESFSYSDGTYGGYLGVTTGDWSQISTITFAPPSTASQTSIILHLQDVTSSLAPTTERPFKIKLYRP
jgi:hypothetical protein